MIDWRNKEHYLDPTATQAIANADWKPLVFICSPFAGDMDLNVKRAKRFMRFALEQGTIPFAPHLLYPQVLDDENVHERELGLTFGLIWLGKCDELWVFGDVISTGMEREIVKAERRSMPIRYFTSDCKEAN